MFSKINHQSSIVNFQNEISVLLRQDIKYLKTVNADHRDDCLVIHGLPEPVEGEREDTDLLVCDNVSDKLGIPLDVSD